MCITPAGGDFYDHYGEGKGSADQSVDVVGQKLFLVEQDGQRLMF